MVKKDANILGGFNLINSVNLYPFPSIVDGNKMINDEITSDLNSISKENLIKKDFKDGENIKLEKNKYYCLNEMINPMFLDMDITWAIVGVDELNGGKSEDTADNYSDATLNTLANRVSEASKIEGNFSTSKTEAIFVSNGIIHVINGSFYLVAEIKQNVKNTEGKESLKLITIMYKNIVPDSTDSSTPSESKTSI